MCTIQLVHELVTLRLPRSGKQLNVARAHLFLVLLHGLHRFLHGFEVSVTLAGRAPPRVVLDVRLDRSQRHEKVLNVLIVAAERHSSQMHTEQILLGAAEKVIAGEATAATTAVAAKAVAATAKVAVVVAPNLAPGTEPTVRAETARVSATEAAATTSEAAVASKPTRAVTSAAAAAHVAASRAVVGSASPLCGKRSKEPCCFVFLASFAIFFTIRLQLLR